MKTLKIKITGELASGKTTLACILREFFEVRGHEVSLSENGAQLSRTVGMEKRFFEPRKIEIVVGAK